MKVAGNLYLPRDLNKSAKHPAIIVGHPMGAVKEQSSNLYAQKLADQGFVTMSLDLSFWGESEGRPRDTVARQELSRHYLSQPSLELTEIGYLLGYEEPNSFTRAFQKWEGTTPGQWRSLRG